MGTAGGADGDAVGEASGAGPPPAAAGARSRAAVQQGEHHRGEHRGGEAE